MIKIFQTIWIYLNLIFVTGFFAILTVLLGFFDKRKTFVGIFPRTWARWFLMVCGVKYNVVGLEHLNPDQKYIFVGNHESALDIPVAVAGLPYNIAFMAKKELFRIPIFGWGMSAAGMIKVDRYNRKRANLSVKNALEQIGKTNISVIIYPEGTRSPSANLLPFKKGGFILAIRSGLPVVPVTIIGAGKIVPKKSLTVNPGQVQLIIDKPITTSDMNERDRGTLAETTREIIQRNKTEY